MLPDEPLPRPGWVSRISRPKLQPFQSPVKEGPRERPRAPCQVVSGTLSFQHRRFSARCPLPMVPGTDSAGGKCTQEVQRPKQGEGVKEQRKGGMAIRVVQAGDIPRGGGNAQVWPGLCPEPWGGAVFNFRRNRPPGSGHHGWGLLEVEESTPTSNSGSPETGPWQDPNRPASRG